jgi:hypothetical protein
MLQQKLNTETLIYFLLMITNLFHHNLFSYKFDETRQFFFHINQIDQNRKIEV